MKKTLKTIFIVMLFTIGFIFTSCTQETGPGVGDPFVGGTEGVRVEFREGAPPETVFDNAKYPFSVILDLENVGESDLDANEGMIKLIGLLPQHFGLGQGDFEKDIDFDLPGVKKNFEGTILPGEMGVIAFENLNYQEDLQGNTQINFQAELCYNYKTRSTTQICIKDDIIGNIGDNTICSLNELKTVHNSGAPVHITEIKETPSGSNKVQLLITVGHVGIGKIFKPETSFTADSCDDSYDNQDKNLVYVEVSLPDTSAADVSCTGLEAGSAMATSGYVRLYQGMPRKFTCTVEGAASGRNVYQELLNVDLEYAYSERLDKTLLIQDVTDEGE
jgi:hypothetical protein